LDINFISKNPKEDSLLKIKALINSFIY